MEIPVRAAWCTLLWTSNGGQMGSNGLPILSSYEREDEEGGSGTWRQGRRGYCDRAFDCNECFLLQAFCEEQQSLGSDILWECTTCAYTPVPGEMRAVPGYYTSLLWATNDDRNVGNLDPLCLRCGEEAPLLQLVLRIKE